MIKSSNFGKRVVHLLACRIEHGFITLCGLFQITDGVTESALKFRLRIVGDPFKFAIQLSGFANHARKLFRTQNNETQDHQEEDLASREIKHIDSLNLDPSGYA